jgi:hypothetical protein
MRAKRDILYRNATLLNFKPEGYAAAAGSLSQTELTSQFRDRAKKIFARFSPMAQRSPKGDRVAAEK